MPARLDQFDAGEQLLIAVDQPVAQAGGIPMRPGHRVAPVGPLLRGGVMRPLDDDLGVREGVVLPGVVGVEVRRDQILHVCGGDAERGEMVRDRDDIVNRHAGNFRLPRHRDKLRCVARVDDDVRAIIRLDQIPRHGLIVLAGQRQLQEIEPHVAPIARQAAHREPRHSLPDTPA